LLTGKGGQVRLDLATPSTSLVLVADSGGGLFFMGMVRGGMARECESLESPKPVRFAI
jgi:hypothetical protein